MDLARFCFMKKRYGLWSSWAVWSEAGCSEPRLRNTQFGLRSVA